MAGVLLRRCSVRVRDISALVVVLVLAPQVAGAEDCTTFQYRAGLFPWHYTQGEACQDVCDAFIANDGATACSFSVNEDFGDAGRCEGTRTMPGFGEVGWVANLARQSGPCPPPDDCATYEGDTSQGFWLLGGVEDTPPQTCHKPSGCLATQLSRSCSEGQCVASYSFSSRIQCDAGGGEGEDPDAVEGEDQPCMQSGSNEWCMTNPNGENCGYLNDSFICLNSTDEDGCQGLGDGGRVCSDGAPVPPVPDSGVPGLPAEPDMELDTDDGQFDYYDAATVGNSSRPPNESGDNPNDGDDDGDGAGGGAGEGMGGAEEGLMCDPETDSGCGEGGDGEGDGDVRGGWQCWADGEGFSAAVGQCFQTAAESLWNTLSAESSLLQVAADTAAAFPAGGGSCPTAPVTLAGESFDFWAVPCQFLDDVEAMLGTLFLLLWSVMGLRILLTIPGGE